MMGFGHEGRPAGGMKAWEGHFCTRAAQTTHDLNTNTYTNTNTNTNVNYKYKYHWKLGKGTFARGPPTTKKVTTATNRITYTNRSATRYANGYLQMMGTFGQWLPGPPTHPPTSGMKKAPPAGGFSRGDLCLQPSNYQISGMKEEGLGFNATMSVKSLERCLTMTSVFAVVWHWWVLQILTGMIQHHLPIAMLFSILYLQLYLYKFVFK